MSTDTAAAPRRRPPLLVTAIAGIVVVFVLVGLALFVLPDFAKRTTPA